MDYIKPALVIGPCSEKSKPCSMFAMLEHHKPAKDIYDDGRLFWTSSRRLQTASLDPIPMEYKMLNLFRKNPGKRLVGSFGKSWGYRREVCGRPHPDNLHHGFGGVRSNPAAGAPHIKTVYGMGCQWTEARQMKLQNLSVKRLPMGSNGFFMSAITIALFQTKRICGAVARRRRCHHVRPQGICTDAGV